MPDRPPRLESTPKVDPYQAFETLIDKKQWSPDIEKELRALLESNESDMYMIYLTYKESGLADELPEHEQQIYAWLTSKFVSIT